jgi:hypothetical protein
MVRRAQSELTNPLSIVEIITGSMPAGTTRAKKESVAAESRRVARQLQFAFEQEIAHISNADATHFAFKRHAIGKEPRWALRPRSTLTRS